MSNPGQETTDNKALRELRDAVIELVKSTKRMNFWMILLTGLIFILTSVLVWQSFIK